MSGDRFLAKMVILFKAFSLTFYLYLQKLWATVKVKNVKPKLVLHAQTHISFETPLPIKQAGYKWDLINTMSRNGIWVLEYKRSLYLRIPMQIS